MDNNLISNKELIEMGYRPHTANDIIHQARELLVSRGYTFYNRKRLLVPSFFGRCPKCTFLLAVRIASFCLARNCLDGSLQDFA